MMFRKSFSPTVTAQGFGTYDVGGSGSGNRGGFGQSGVHFQGLGDGNGNGFGEGVVDGEGIWGSGAGFGDGLGQMCMNGSGFSCGRGYGNGLLFGKSEYADILTWGLVKQ